MVAYRYIAKEGKFEGAPLPYGSTVYRINRPDGKRLQGTGGGPRNVLVEDRSGRRFVVPGRPLRRIGAADAKPFLRRCVLCGDWFDPEHPTEGVYAVNPKTFRKTWMHVLCGVIEQDALKGKPASSDEFDDRHDEYIQFVQ